MLQIGEGCVWWVAAVIAWLLRPQNDPKRGPPGKIWNLKLASLFACLKPWGRN